MVSRYITEPIIKLIHELNREFNGDIVFCGSFGLVFNDKLDREIGDIDALVFSDYYHGGWSKDDTKFIRDASSSDIFDMDDHMVYCFSLHHCDIKGIGADILYMPDGHKPIYDEVDFYGVKIKIEEPGKAIVAKKKYVASPKLKHKTKHQSDLEFMSPENRDDLPF